MDLKDKLKRLLDSPYRDFLGEDDLQSEGESLSLRQRLELIYRRSREEQGLEGKVSAPKRIEELVQGRVEETPYGQCFVREIKYPSGYCHGEVSLSTLLEVTPESCCKLTGDERFNQWQHSKAIFVDTETTGLSGGTGTFIFMIGLGYFRGEHFHLWQFFARDYSEEMAILHLVESLTKPFQFLVTFNGKQFDLPLLQTRYRLSRMDTILPQLSHFDLIYPSRRIWRLRLENCRLSTLERSLLGVIRRGDVPGEEIPQVYFDYLRSQNATLIARVFYHNAQDILSLVGLMATICLLYHKPFSQGEWCGEDFYSLGRLFHQLGEAEKGSRCYLQALNSGIPAHLVPSAFKALSFIYKKNREWDKALQAWDDLLVLGEREFDLFPYEEIAKYWEHQRHDYTRATEVVERALLHIHRAKEELLPDRYAAMERALEYRLRRLRLRVQGKRWY